MKENFVKILMSLMLAMLASVTRATIIGSGECGAGLTWTLTDEGVLTISGIGAMKNWEGEFGESSPFFRNENIRFVILSEGVTDISPNTFYRCSNLTTIALPSTLTSIGNYAFYECNELISLDIPESVTNIGEYTFYECSGLTSVKIPESLTSIGEYTFHGCM